MRTVFIGASAFGLKCLQLAASLPEIRLVGVVTAPAEFKISYRPQGMRNVLHADFCGRVRHLGVPCVQISDGMRDPTLLEQVRLWRPDAFLVVGWYHMVPRSFRAIAPAYGLHASLLPDYSGGAPLVWALINGERRTGITFFRLEDGVDSGPVVGQLATDISPDDTIATLYARVEQLGLQLLKDFLPSLAAGTAELRVQDERRRRVFPQRQPEDGLIDWSQPAAHVSSFVRAQTSPYPGAFFWLGSHKVTIWQIVAIGHFDAATPGRIIRDGSRVLIGCGNSEAIEVTELSVDSLRMDPAAFFDEFVTTGLQL